MSFSIWEQVILGFLLAASISLFARDLSRKLRLITSGKPERRRTDRIGARVVRALREVALQSRVIGGRPVVGTLHGIVFLGFIAFGVETLDHFLEAFGLAFLAPLFGQSLSGFKNFLAVVAILVGLGIIGLAFRRFVLVKISPDPKSYTSGIVALFILLLMLTYLNGLRESPLALKANWWLHSGIILVFPNLILRSKHFHIIMAPVNIFLRTHRLGEFLPLALDEETLAQSDDISLGLETTGSLPWKMRMDFLTCVECRRCTEQCPAAYCDQELRPREFILAGRRALSGNGADASVIGSIISENALGQCTSCGACENICPVGIEHLQLLIGAKRAQALSIGKGMVAAEFLERIENYGNPFASPKDTRAQLIRDLELPLFEKDKTNWLLWLGCAWGYQSDARNSVASMAAILKQAGVNFGVLEEEPCCGHHSRRQGEEMQFQNLGREAIAALKEKGATKLITACPHCLHTIRREYPTLAPDFSISAIHHSEMITSLIDRGAIELDANGHSQVVTYHDPCYLGRYEKIYESPRQAIGRAGFKLQELPRHGERSFCCGGGSAGFVREQKVHRRIDQERKAEIAASGAKILVTACPECKMMLNAAVDETKDVAEIVAASMKTNGKVSSSSPQRETDMVIEYDTTTEIAGKIHDYFILHPEEELHLLSIVTRAHLSGNLKALKRAADGLVKDGDLALRKRAGVRYYRLAD